MVRSPPSQGGGDGGGGGAGAGVGQHYEGESGALLAGMVEGLKSNGHADVLETAMAAAAAVAGEVLGAAAAAAAVSAAAGLQEGAGPGKGEDGEGSRGGFQPLEG